MNHPFLRHHAQRTWFASLLIPLLLCSSTHAADEPSPSAKPEPYTQKIPGSEVEFRMVPVPKGKFLMGSSPAHRRLPKNEKPAFEVEVDGFWIGTCEITWEEYNLFAQSYHLAKKVQAPVLKDREADAVSFPTPLYQEKLGPVLGWGVNGKMPAVCMTQFAAKQYTKWLSKKTGHFYRLPSEAEWEYAARAGTNSAWSFGDDPAKLGEHAWYSENSDVQYHEVGKKKPNAWGLYDMHGNVAEWCLDAYDENQYAKWARDSELGRSLINWPTKLDPRIVRGGHWDALAEDCRSAARWYSDKSWKQNDPQLPKSIWWQTDVHTVGFRVVRPMKVPTKEEQAKYWEPDLESLREILKNDLQSRMVVEPG